MSRTGSKLPNNTLELIGPQWRPMVTQNLVNIGSGNGLMPVGTKPLPEPMLTYHHWNPSAFSWQQFHRLLWISLTTKYLKTTYLKILPHLPGGNELMHTGTPLYTDWESSTKKGLHLVLLHIWLTRYFAFCNLSPPGCFRPWTFFQNNLTWCHPIPLCLI